MQQITDGVHRFDGDGVNFYVIEGDDGLTVVDAGFSGHWKTFATWLHKYGSSPREVVAVLLTHNHPDHIGIAGRAQAEGASVHAHADDRDGLTKPLEGGLPTHFRDNVWRPQLLRRLGRWVAAGMARPPVLREVITCADGDVLDVPGAPRAIHVPGHTPGSTAYAFDDHGVICVGDALVTFDPATGRPGISIPPTSMNADDRQALRSLDKLVGEGADIMLPGHGEPYHDGIAGAVHAARAIGPYW